MRRPCPAQWDACTRLASSTGAPRPSLHSSYRFLSSHLFLSSRLLLSSIAVQGQRYHLPGRPAAGQGRHRGGCDCRGAGRRRAALLHQRCAWGGPGHHSRQLQRFAQLLPLLQRRPGGAARRWSSSWGVWLDVLAAGAAAGRPHTRPAHKHKRDGQRTAIPSWLVVPPGCSLVHVPTICFPGCPCGMQA